MVGIDVKSLSPHIPLNSFSVSNMARSFSLVTVYLDWVPESFRIKNAMGLLSWVITAPICLVDASVALWNLDRPVPPLLQWFFWHCQMLFDKFNPSAKVSFLPCFYGWSLSLRILPLNLKEGLAFHYTLPTCHGNIVPFQGSALTPWHWWADLLQVLPVLFWSGVLFLL